MEVLNVQNDSIYNDGNIYGNQNQSIFPNIGCINTAYENQSYVSKKINKRPRKYRKNYKPSEFYDCNNIYARSSVMYDNNMMSTNYPIDYVGQTQPHFYHDNNGLQKLQNGYIDQVNGPPFQLLFPSNQPQCGFQDVNQMSQAFYMSMNMSKAEHKPTYAEQCHIGLQKCGRSLGQFQRSDKQFGSTQSLNYFCQNGQSQIQGSWRHNGNQMQYRQSRQGNENWSNFHRNSNNNNNPPKRQSSNASQRNGPRNYRRPPRSNSNMSWRPREPSNHGWKRRNQSKQNNHNRCSQVDAQPAPDFRRNKKPVELQFGVTNKLPNHASCPSSPTHHHQHNHTHVHPNQIRHEFFDEPLTDCLDELQHNIICVDHNEEWLFDENDLELPTYAFDAENVVRVKTPTSDKEKAAPAEEKPADDEGDSDDGSPIVDMNVLINQLKDPQLKPNPNLPKSTLSTCKLKASLSDDNLYWDFT